MIRPKSFPHKKPAISFLPDVICKSIVDIDFTHLKKHGITTCFIDLDGTVVSRESFDVDPRIAKTLSGCSLAIHIATNRPKSRSLKSLKEDLSATSVIHPHGFFGKPFKRYYINALKDLHLKPNEVIMIGDRYIQDIYGSNRAGIYSMAVYKLGSSKGKLDYYFSKLEGLFTTRIAGRYKSIK